MAGNTQIDPKTEGGLFSFLHGLTGYFIAVALLLTILGVLTTLAIQTQNANATNFYSINQDLNGLKLNSTDNHKQRTNVNEKDK
jgi:succinate dehydrogenase/fumarate reductase cytochrome b subunit